MGPRELKQFCALDDHIKEMLQFAMTDMSLSARAYDRILKVARTIADLTGSDPITADHIGEAIQFRSLDRQLWGGTVPKFMAWTGSKPHSTHTEQDEFCVDCGVSKSSVPSVQSPGNAHE